MLAGASRLDGSRLMRVELIDPDVPERVAKRSWQGIGQLRIAGRFRWDMPEMDGLPVRRVTVAKLVHEPINIMDGRR